jgi:hypothetical protein
VWLDLALPRPCPSRSARLVADTLCGCVQCSVPPPPVLAPPSELPPLPCPAHKHTGRRVLDAGAGQFFEERKTDTDIDK